MSPHTSENQKPKNTTEQIVSARFDNKHMLEMLYAPRLEKCMLAHWDGAECKLIDTYESRPGCTLAPLCAGNAMLKHGVVKLASYIEDHRNAGVLVDEIKAFIHRYVDLEEGFETIAAYYVLLSWVYDRFRELPYLRLVGDYGTGKTRFLQVVGSLCYKAIFASGASTISPLFHMLDQFRGTLILDEADFRFSDATSEIAKILNNGNMAGFPVLRCEGNRQGRYDPRAFWVFGPKIVASRHHYTDPALESRFIYERTKAGSVRKDIPTSLPDAFEREAQSLRNRLLMYRFTNWHRIDPQAAVDADFHNRRIAQIYRPLFALALSDADRSTMQSYAEKSRDYLQTLRSHSAEEKILLILSAMITAGMPTLAIKAVTDRYRSLHAQEHTGPITPKWIGGIIRNRLHLRTTKRNGVYVIAGDDFAKLSALFERYDIHSQSTVAKRTAPHNGRSPTDSASLGEQDRPSAV